VKERVVRSGEEGGDVVDGGAECFEV